MFKRMLHQTNSFYKLVLGDFFLLLLSILGAAVATGYDELMFNLFYFVNNEAVVFGTYTVIIFLLTYPLLFVLNFFAILFVNYKKDSLQNQIDLVPYAGFKGKDTNYAWLKIVNNSEFDLEDCYLELKEFLRHGESGFLLWKDYVLLNTNKLAWPDFEKNVEKKVRRKSSARINVAKLVPNQEAVKKAEDVYLAQVKHELGPDFGKGLPIHPVVHQTMENEKSNRLIELTMEDGDRQAFPVRRNYYLELGFNGKIDNSTFREIPFTGFLFHDCIGDQIRFFFEKGKQYDYEAILKRLDSTESELLPEEIEYFKQSQPWRDWCDKKNP